jgi:hypothetical protein
VQSSGRGDGGKAPKAAAALVAPSAVHWSHARAQLPQGSACWSVSRHVSTCVFMYMSMCIHTRADAQALKLAHTHTHTRIHTQPHGDTRTHARTRMKNGAERRVTQWSDKAMLSYTTDVRSVARRSDCLPAFALTGTGLVLDGVIVTVRDSRLFRHSRCRAPPGGDGRRHAERHRGRINRCAPLRTSIEISPLQPPSVAPVAVQE